MGTKGTHNASVEAPGWVLLLTRRILNLVYTFMRKLKMTRDGKPVPSSNNEGIFKFGSISAIQFRNSILVDIPIFRQGLTNAPSALL